MPSIAVIAGDGVGQEVIPAGLRVLEAVTSLDVEMLPWGAEYYAKTGTMMPDDALTRLDTHDAIYLGAVAGPLAGRGPDDIDMVFIRENTEGEYSGTGGRVHVGTPYEVAVEAPVFTRIAVERVARYALDLAQARSGSLVSVTKSNASRYAYVLWDEVVAAAAADYPGVNVQRMHVDAMAARMVLRPDTIDVVVASNLFADILTDLGAAFQGSLGLAASANLDPTGTHPSLFEPVHGSAPDIAGQGRANPVGAIWSGALMLRHLGLGDEAARVEQAVAQVLADGAVRTADLGGSATTGEVADAVIEALRAAGRVSK
jgi:tartrate dehydrogenase/decarboxylase / D-malate dehydrogenase